MNNTIIPPKKQNVKRKRITVELPPTIDGKRRRKEFYGRTLKEARAKADEWKANNAVCDALGVPRTRSRIPLSQVAERFLAIKQSQIKPYSFATTYRQPYDKHIAPALGACFISTIDTAALDDYFLGNADLSERTLSKLRMILHAIFELAIEYGYIDRNPADSTHIAGRKTEPRHTYTAEQYQSLYDYAEAHNLTDIVLLLDSGIRRSELLSLCWRDIYTNERYIVIDSALTPDGDGGTKTANSNRLVPITQRAADYLASVRGKSGDRVVAYTPSGYAKMFRQRMEGIAAELDIPCLTPHELRHTFGTLAHADGIDVLTISRAMGHSTVGTTAKYYVHDDLEAIRQGLKR